MTGRGSRRDVLTCRSGQLERVMMRRRAHSFPSWNLPCSHEGLRSASLLPPLPPALEFLEYRLVPRLEVDPHETFGDGLGGVGRVGVEAANLVHGIHELHWAVVDQHGMPFIAVELAGGDAARSEIPVEPAVGVGWVARAPVALIEHLGQYRTVVPSARPHIADDKGAEYGGGGFIDHCEEIAVGGRIRVQPILVDDCVHALVSRNVKQIKLEEFVLGIERDCAVRIGVPGPVQFADRLCPYRWDFH